MFGSSIIVTVLVVLDDGISIKYIIIDGRTGPRDHPEFGGDENSFVKLNTLCVIRKFDVCTLAQVRGRLPLHSNLINYVPLQS